MAGCCACAGIGGYTRLCTGGHASLQHAAFSLVPYRPRVAPAP